jgi:hypothetical protein
MVASDVCSLWPTIAVIIGTFNALSDISILVIPLPILWRVQIPIRRKIALGVVFSLGYFVIITTILRSYYSVLSLNTLPIALGWASRETFCATIAVCAPGIKPLFSKTHWLRSTRARSRSFQCIEASEYRESTTSAPRTLSTAHITADPDDNAITALPSIPAIPGKQPRLELSDWIARPHGRIGRMSFSGESDERIMLEEDSCREFVIIREPVGVKNDVGRAM